jgi:hypothetical protein
MEPCSPIQALRGPKIFDMSTFDWVTSLGAAAIVGHFAMHLKKPIHWVVFLVAWTLTGVLIHLAVGVDTMLGYYLGLNPKPVRKPCV